MTVQEAALTVEKIREMRAAGSITEDEMFGLLTRCVQQAGKAAGTLTFKVSEKGALSVYGLQARFPVTLYASQWERLLESADKLQEFIKANAKTLARKA